MFAANFAKVRLVVVLTLEQNIATNCTIGCFYLWVMGCKPNSTRPHSVIFKAANLYQFDSSYFLCYKVDVNIKVKI